MQVGSCNENEAFAAKALAQEQPVVPADPQACPGQAQPGVESMLWTLILSLHSCCQTKLQTLRCDAFPGTACADATNASSVWNPFHQCRLWPATSVWQRCLPASASRTTPTTPALRDPKCWPARPISHGSAWQMSTTCRRRSQLTDLTTRCRLTRSCPCCIGAACCSEVMSTA